MFAYIYVIKNNIYPDNVYKLDISRQNINQLTKKYNKYYINCVKIVCIYLVRDYAIANKLISDKFCKHFIKNTSNFIKCDFNIVKNKLIEIEKILNGDVNYQHKIKNINKNISKFISFACKKKIGNNILVNEFYNLFDKEKTLDYLEFIYIIKNNGNVNIIEINNNIFIKNMIFINKNINIFDQFVDQMLINSAGHFASVNKIVTGYKKWHLTMYPFLKISFKNKLKDNLIKSVKKMYGDINYNKYSIKCKNGWNNVTII